MVRDKVTVKNENANKPNADADALIEYSKSILKPGVASFITDSKFLEIQEINLNELAAKKTEAKIIVHKDKEGATVISSTGSITSVGKENVQVDESNIFQRTDLDHAKKQFNYAVKLAGEYLKNDGVISSDEKLKIEELDKVLESVVVIVSKGYTEVTIADSFGNYKTISKKTLNIG